MLRDFGPNRFRAASTAAAMAAAVLLAQFAGAAPNIDQAGALELVPQDAAFYGASLRNRQRVEAVLNSRAVAKLKEMEAVKEGLEELKQQLEGPEMAVPRALLSLPENVRLVEMLLDMVSDEVFIYGSGGYVDVIDSMNELNGVLRRAQIEGALEGKPDEQAAIEAVAKAASQLKDVAIPDTVIGFSLDDADRAKTQLKRLEVLITLGLAQQEEALKSRFKRVTIGQGEYLTFELDGSLLPWEEMLAELDGDELEAVEQIVEVVKKKTLTISLGVLDNYLLLSIGDDNGHLATLGKGKTLASHPKLKPVIEHADRELVSIGYVSEPFAKKANSADGQIDDLIELIEQAMPLADIPEARKAPIVADVKALGKEIQGVLPEAGAAVSFAFLTKRGVEGFSYDWSECHAMDASKPLTILNHVGKNPLMFCASRTKRSVACYRRCVHWLGKAVEHAEAIGVPQMDPEDRGVYKQVRSQMLPLLKQLDRATAEQMIPALADGQGALVIDAGAKNVKWCDEMEAADTPLPLPLPSLVLGVSDAELLKQGYEQYVDVINKAALKLHALDPDEVPRFRFPEPTAREVSEGTLYAFALPTELGINPKILPSIGLSDDTVVLTLSRRNARALLKSEPLSLGGPLSDLGKPMSGACYCNWAGIVETLRPWVHYGAKQEAKTRAVALFDDDGDDDDGDEDEDEEDEEEDEPDLEEILAQVDTVLDILKCVRGFSAATYTEGGATVTHFEMQVQDLKP